MIDFKKELDKLLSLNPNPEPYYDELQTLLSENNKLISNFSVKQNDISLQVEEIFDIIQSSEDSSALLRGEKKRNEQSIAALVTLSDIIEDFYAFARQSRSPELEHQANLMWKNSGAVLDACSLSRIGLPGEPLNPALHNVRATQASEFPREHISAVLQSGYLYMGNLYRKAAVILSNGKEELTNE